MTRVGTCRLNREGVSAIQMRYRKGRWANIDAFCHAYSIPRSTYYELIARDKWFEQATIQDKLTALGISGEDQSRLCEFRDATTYAVPASTSPFSDFNVPLNNLPVQPTSFIGRQTEKTTVKSLLAANPLVTLTGTGGCGKTRLALQVATELIPDYRDGVWLVEMAALASPELVPQALLMALGLREEPARPGIETITTHLKSRSLVLVIDNCEHVLLACAHLATSILRSCPHVKILATSREALAIAGETVWRVPSLMQPESSACNLGSIAEAEQLALLASYDAIRLFVERARAVRTDFALTPQNAAQIAETCRRLDGMPLAIELAAARTKSLSVQEINRHLDHRFQLLTGGDRTALPRQQTLRALMDWSYDLLTTPEKLFLHRLSVFAGGWTLEAAEEVCAGEVLGVRRLALGVALEPSVNAPTPNAQRQTLGEAPDALDLLTSLIDKSLVVAEVRDRSTRYRLLETVRDYALERLRESDEHARVMRCHQDYFVSFAEMAQSELSGADQGFWLQRVEEEHENLRVGLDRALQVPASPDLMVMALRYCAAMGYFWLLRGHLNEGREWCVRALRMGISDSGDERGVDLAANDIRLTRARVLHAAARLATVQGDHAYARGSFEESLRLCQEIGDPDGVASALRGLGLVAWYRSDYASALTYYGESMALCRERANLDGIADALVGLGHVAHYQGDTAVACNYYQESLGLYREIGNPGSIANLLNHLGNVAESEGDYVTARIYHEESLSVRREIGERNGIANSLSNLGLAALWQGDYLTALTNFEESLTICRQIGNRNSIAFNLNNLGNLAHSQGDYTSAGRYYQESLAIRREIGNRRGIANALNGLGNTAWRQGKLAEARAFFEESLVIGREIGERYDITVSLAGLGDVARLEGMVAQARTCYQESLSLAHAMRYRKAIAHLLEAYAALIARENIRENIRDERDTSDAPPVSDGYSPRAALLWGVADALRREINSPIPPGDRPAYERAIAETRQRLGDVAFNRAWEAGRTMSLEQVIAGIITIPSPTI